MFSFLTIDGKFSYLKLACQVAVLIALVAALMSFVTSSKSMTLVVDGHSSNVSAYGGNVASVLKRADVAVGGADHITPALDSPVEDGGTITVNTSKKITVSLDGAERTVTTTSNRISGLINQLGIAANASISAPASSLLSNSSDITIITPKDVTLVADGKQTKKNTTAAKVSDVLAEANIKLSATDRVSVPGTSKIVNKMVIKVTRVDTTGTASETADVPFETVQSVDANMFKDERKVLTEGAPGTLETTFSTVVVDGVEASRAETGSKVIKAPVAAKIAVGGKDRPAPEPAPEPAPAPAEAGANTGAAAPAASNVGMWDAIAQCESTGNWSINTGNGYYGGLQFDIGTWLSAGGGAYAPNASLATKEQQIDIANRVYAQRGLSPWGCGHAAG